MDRIKDYDATGIAPDGRIYAGDLNLLQDLVAALVDYTQNLGVGSIAIGDSGLSISKFGTGELQLAAGLRMTGVLRAAGGLLPGTFTTTTRNAIAAGSRPALMIIWNSTTAQYEYNAGSDATPNWQPLFPSFTPSNAFGGSGNMAGLILDFAGDDPALIPALTDICDGRYRDITADAVLYAKIGTKWNNTGGLPDPPMGKYRLPDLRGRGTIGSNTMGSGNAHTPVISGASIARGGAATVGAIIGEENHVLSVGEIPSHNHGGVTGNVSNDHTHVYGRENVSLTSGSTVYSIIGNAATTDHSTGGENTGHTHTVSSQGGGGSHENVFPVAMVTKVITLA